MAGAATGLTAGPAAGRAGGAVVGAGRVGAGVGAGLGEAARGAGEAVSVGLLTITGRTGSEGLGRTGAAVPWGRTGAEPEPPLGAAGRAGGETGFTGAGAACRPCGGVGELGVGAREGATGSEVVAFFTERIALAGAAGAAGAAAWPADSPPAPWIRLRILVASSSLIELLWLFAAMESFSAASSTSLLSRPRSRDSS